MNETLSSSSEWMQFYQQAIDGSFGFSDATTVTTVTSGNKLRPSSSFVAGDHLTPNKGRISKPVRRRSRASKRTPTTLLNADTKNFRSLVQQFTGCRRRSTSISFGNPRGPVNINFALAKEHDYHSTDHSSISQPLIENNYSPKSQQQQNYRYQFQQQLSNEEQECQFSLDSITTDHDDFLLTSSCFPRSGSEIPQGFVMDDMYFLA
ncbi:VQ motif-containing protein 22-like [Durio zibethinus]|uniref:VQ motif-containing protein 22-like n=1 Tax=Durio zibethinus TaxID=66656 RepID=A0A6P6ABC0_DURZI|nr:VQ motif-containing protein 22-like [Durio zibethinus]